MSNPIIGKVDNAYGGYWVSLDQYKQYSWEQRAEVWFINRAMEALTNEQCPNEFVQISKLELAKIKHQSYRDGLMQGRACG